MGMSYGFFLRDTTHEYIATLDLDAPPPVAVMALDLYKLTYESFYALVDCAPIWGKRTAPRALERYQVEEMLRVVHRAVMAPIESQPKVGPGLWVFVDGQWINEYEHTHELKQVLADYGRPVTGRGRPRSLAMVRILAPTLDAAPMAQGV